MASGGVRLQVPLIAQTSENSCWFACLAMLAFYHCGQGEAVGYPLIPLTMGYLGRDSMIPNAEMARIVGILGLRFRQWDWLNGETLLDLLTNTGPVATGGTWLSGASGHMVVITGMDGSMLYINDPWPPSRGEQWRADFFTFKGSWLRPPYLIYRK